MSKLVRKIYFNHPSRRTAEILVYPDGCHVVIRDEYQYPIIGKSVGSETSAKRFMFSQCGKGWKESFRHEYTWKQNK